MKNKRKNNNINIIKVLMLLIILLSIILIWKIVQGTKTKKVGSDKLELPRIRTSTNTTVEVLKKLVE